MTADTVLLSDAVSPSPSILSTSIYTYNLDSTGCFISGSSSVDEVLALGPSASLFTSSRQRNHNLASYIHTPISHPSLTLDSFYPRLSVSRDGAFLASGSSTGKILLWDANALLDPFGLEESSKPVVLAGHTAETSCVDWGYDTVSLPRFSRYLDRELDSDQYICCVSLFLR